MAEHLGFRTLEVGSRQEFEMRIDLHLFHDIFHWQWRLYIFAQYTRQQDFLGLVLDPTYYSCLERALSSLIDLNILRTPLIDCGRRSEWLTKPKAKAKAVIESSRRLCKNQKPVGEKWSLSIVKTLYYNSMFKICLWLTTSGNVLQNPDLLKSQLFRQSSTLSLLL